MVSASAGRVAEEFETRAHGYTRAEPTREGATQRTDARDRGNGSQTRRFAAQVSKLAMKQLPVAEVQHLSQLNVPDSHFFDFSRVPAERAAVPRCA